MKQALNRIHPGRFLYSLLVMLMLSMAFAKPVQAWITSCPTIMINTFHYDETLIEDTRPPMDPEEPSDPDLPQEPAQPENPDGPSDEISPETPGDTTAPDTNQPAGSKPPIKPSTNPGTGVALMTWDLAIAAIASAAMLVIWRPYLKRRQNDSETAE